MPNPDPKQVDAVFSESGAEDWLEDLCRIRKLAASGGCDDCDDSDAIIFGNDDDWWDEDDHWWY